MKKEKKQKAKYIDDGHTIYNMQVDADWAKKDKESTETLTKEERKILIKAAFRAYFPKLLLVLASFGLAIFIIYLWLN